MSHTPLGVRYPASTPRSSLQSISMTQFGGSQLRLGTPQSPSMIQPNTPTLQGYQSQSYGRQGQSSPQQYAYATQQRPGSSISVRSVGLDESGFEPDSATITAADRDRENNQQQQEEEKRPSFNHTSSLSMTQVAVQEYNQRWNRSNSMASTSSSIPPTRVASPRGPSGATDSPGFNTSQQFQQYQNYPRGGVLAPSPSLSTISSSPPASSIGTVHSVNMNSSNNNNMFNNMPSQQQQQQQQQHQSSANNPAVVSYPLLTASNIPTYTDSTHAASRPSTSSKQSARPPIPLGRRASLPGEIALQQVKESKPNKLLACFTKQLTPSIIFSQPLTQLYERYHRLPGFLEISLAYLQTRVEKYQDMFTVTGASSSSSSSSAASILSSSEAAIDISKQEQKFTEYVNYLEESSEHTLNIVSLEYYGVSTVAYFLKRFLQQLEEPLCTWTRYEQMVKVAGWKGEQQQQQVQQQIQQPNLMRAQSNPSPLPSASASASASPPPSQQSLSSQINRGSYPLIALSDQYDQLLLMQSLILSLPTAHFLLLSSLINLLHNIYQHTKLKYGGSESKAVGEIQKICLVLAGVVMTNPIPLVSSTQQDGSSKSSSSTSKKDLALLSSHTQQQQLQQRQLQEQQVLLYLIQNYRELFQRNAVRELAQGPQLQSSTDPNPLLQSAVSYWRSHAGQLKLNFSKRHFDFRAMTLVFRAWKQRSKTNRRKAEAYRQLALLKAELLTERKKCMQLTQELQGLKEEVEMRDFKDQLRVQTGSFNFASSTSRQAIPHGSTQYALQQAPYQTVLSSSSKHFYQDEEKEHSYPTTAVRMSTSRAGDAPRDLAQDLAGVRALQEQDRQLAQQYGRYN